MPKVEYDEWGWHAAGLHTYAAWESLRAATTLGDQAAAVRDLDSAMSDLATFLPGYDYNTGEVKDPRDPYV